MRIVADDAIPGVREALADAAELCLVPGSAIDAASVRGADALLVRTVTRVDDRLLGESSLRFVGSATAGIDHVDLEALARRGIAFAHAPGCNAGAVAQYVLTAIYHLAATRDDRLARCPVGIVGFGHVGRRVAATLRALDREVLVNDPPLANTRPGSDEDISFQRLDTLVADCGVITLHVPLVRVGGHATHHLVDAAMVRELSQRGTLLVNTSRGGVLDEAGLLGPNLGPGLAVLDVWEGEPDLRWPLLEPGSPVVLGTPHIAGYSQEGKLAATQMVMAALSGCLGLDLAEPSVAPPSGPRLVPGNAGAALRTFAESLTRGCDLPSDDRSLRGLLALPLAQRAAEFERLRAGHALRREPVAWG